VSPREYIRHVLFCRAGDAGHLIRAAVGNAQPTKRWFLGIVGSLRRGIDWGLDPSPPAQDDAGGGGLCLPDETVGQFASFCRWVGSTRLSNGKRKGQGNTKNGNTSLAWAFVEAAHFAMRSESQIRQFYQVKQAPPKHMKPQVRIEGLPAEREKRAEA
jgi:hypothetical protein